MKWLSLLLILLCGFARGQDFPRKDFNLEKLADEIFPLQDLDLNYEDLYENLAQLLSRPLDLNSITREQMRSLFVVPESSIGSFMQFRDEQGPLLSIYELQSVPGWDRSLFDKVIPFVTVKDLQSKLNGAMLGRIAGEDSYLLIRVGRTLEPSAAYSPETDSAHRYQGSPEKIYMRYRISRVNDFSFGFTVEKDAGESMNWNAANGQDGFDYWSVHAQVVNKGRLKNLVVGDFQTQFGQGLILGSVFGFGKNAETITTVRRSNLGFLPYTSMNENLFFRGLAGSFSLSKNFIIHGFISHRYKDGNEEGDDEVSSFTTSGLHRTQDEINKRQQVGETVMGGVLQFKSNELDAGIVVNQTDFDKSINSNPSPYNQFVFRGSHNLNTSLYLNYSFANFAFFSEAAQSFNHGSAVVAGLLGSFGKTEISLLFRDFSRDFYTFTANAFSENTLPQNEQGFYWGLKHSFSKKYSVSGYFDLFQFPWLRFRGYAPSDGNEWLVRFNYAPVRGVLLYVQAREESKIRNPSAETNLYQVAFGTKRNFWINCDYTVTRNLSMKTRVQFSSFDFDRQVTRGLALVQDISFSIRRCKISARYALFDTDDYDNRLYLYEKDVWLAYSFPAYDGVGVKMYVMFQYNLSKHVDLWFRWSKVTYSDRDVVGSGGDQVAGNALNDVKLQARIRF